MFTSILRIIGRIALILLVAAAVIGFVTMVSKTTSNTSGFRSDGEQRFLPQPGQVGNNQAGQPARPPRREGGGEGFEGSGSIARGLIQVFTNGLLIGVFVWIGLLIFRRNKRQPPTSLQGQVEP